MNLEPVDWNNRIISIIAVVFIVIFLVLSFLGNYGPSLMTNEKCFSLLGCNVGFFGYDAFIHFINGIMEAAIILWLMIKFSPFYFFGDNFWKNLLMVIMMVTFISFLWEFGEFFHDQFRIEILHENLIIPDILDQPTNTDTMGDTTFSILGAVFTFSSLWLLVRKKSVTI